MDFKNKVVIVTGASSGIGAATAVEFAKLDAKVSLVGRNEERLNNVAEQCATNGPKPLIIKADVSNEDDAEKIIDETIMHFGKLDVLVNNAGIFSAIEFSADSAFEKFDTVFKTNLRAVVVLTKLAVKHLKKTKGNIINVSSICGIKPDAKFWAYGTSKAALDHFSKAIAMKLAGKGIRVNVVNPGPVRTRMLTTNKDEAAIEMVKQITGLKHITEPEEIADVITFLASDKARSVTGSCYTYDAGTLVVNKLFSK